jgi:hypothetical protein
MTTQLARCVHNRPRTAQPLPESGHKPGMSGVEAAPPLSMPTLDARRLASPSERPRIGNPHVGNVRLHVVAGWSRMFVGLL